MRTAFLIVALTLFLAPATLQAQPGKKADRNSDGAQQDRPQRGDRAREGERAGQAKGAKGNRQRGQQRRRQFNPQQMFQRLDQNQDGVITSDELPERIRERLQNADTGGDGAIDKQEFMAHMRKAMQQRGQGGPGAKGRMQRGGAQGAPGAKGRRGNKGDGNAKGQGQGKGKGQGDAKGRRGQRADRPVLSLRNPENLNAEKVMEVLDRSGDGALQKSELPKMMSSKMERVDADGDEVVSLTELRSAIEKMKAKAMDAGKGRYSSDPNASKGQVPKRPGSGN